MPGLHIILMEVFILSCMHTPGGYLLPINHSFVSRHLRAVYQARSKHDSREIIHNFYHNYVAYGVSQDQPVYMLLLCPTTFNLV